jgi:serine/threonine protein kinase
MAHFARRKPFSNPGHVPNTDYNIGHDPVSLTLRYCQDKFPLFVDDPGPDLDVDDLPWDFFPEVLQILCMSKRELNDICDGHMIDDNVINETVDVLRTFVNHCRLAGVVLDPHDGFSYEDVLSYAKTCSILFILELRDALPIFMAAGVDDSLYPLPADVLAELFSADVSSRPITQFLTEQSRFNAPIWEKGEHRKLGKHEVLPLRSIRPLGHGVQGSVDCVELVTTGVRYARKRWRSTSSQANRQFTREISLLRGLDSQRHIIEILGTYVRAPTEVGIVMMLANCDLGHILSLPTEERRRIILDDDLRKGYGCLSFALSYMHSLGIRHKDIKPQNVLIRNSQLVFTDFGVSKDISELTDSLTAGTTGTRKYKAPEFSKPGGVSGQAAADVFALGLVLLSVWSALEGWQPEDTQHFTTLGSISPFFENMPAIHRWIEDRLDDHIQPSIPRNHFHRKWDILQLRILSRMVVAEPSERLRMSEVVAILQKLSVEASFCTTCQEIVREDEHEDVEMSWVLNPSNKSELKNVIGHDKVEIKRTQPQEYVHEENEDDSHDVDADEDENVEQIPVNLPQVISDESDSADSVDSDTEEHHKHTAEGTGTTTGTLPEYADPPVQVQDSTSTPPLPSRDQRIIFVDCYGRRYPCPYRSVHSWEVRLHICTNMIALIAH